jgi:hypothetical protein
MMMELIKVYGVLILAVAVLVSVVVCICLSLLVKDAMKIIVEKSKSEI